jgi:mono/diheme cytochrome c family protein
MINRPIATLFAGLLTLLSAPAQGGDAAHGAVVAKRWCADCHVVSSHQTTAKADAPPFADIAHRLDDKTIAAFLTNPHPRMPDMSLTRKEIEDITAYIRSLDPRPRAPVEPDGKDRKQPQRG